MEVSRISRAVSAAIFALALGLVSPVPATAGGGGAPKPALGPPFFKFRPIILSIIDQGEPLRQIGLVLTLELHEGKDPMSLEPQRRRLVDAFISELYPVYDEKGTEGGIVDSQTIKDKIQGASERILGPGVVRAVLLQQSYERARNPTKAR